MSAIAVLEGTLSSLSYASNYRRILNIFVETACNEIQGVLISNLWTPERRLPYSLSTYGILATKKLITLATTVRTIEPTKAGRNPATTKPGVIAPASQMVIALITKRNSPKVTIVSGSVRRTKSGLTMALTSPNTIAAIAAAAKLVTMKPGTI